eukprot:m.259562 g.259562  ORF g.259562 m.259562 type:complete len:908 (+) comp40423_c1_seq7:203-2926(+)
MDGDGDEPQPNQPQAQGQGGFVSHPKVSPQFFENGDVEAWLKHFAKCAMANGWDDATKLRVAPAYLTKRAGTIYDRLQPDRRDTFAHLSEALIAAFSPNTPERRKLARKAFFSRKWASAEPVERFVQDLERLATKGFPDQDDAARENMLKEQFAEGMPSAIGAELDLHMKNTDSFADVITRGQDVLLMMENHPGRFPQFKAQTSRSHAIAAVGGLPGIWSEPTATDGAASVEALRSLQEQVAQLQRNLKRDKFDDFQQSYQDEKNRSDRAPSDQRLCYRCNQGGHIARYCRVTLPADSAAAKEKPPIVCLRCKETGHIAARCPAPTPKQDSAAATTEVCHVKGSISSLVTRGKVKDAQLDCLVDTGATVSLIPVTLVTQPTEQLQGAREVKGVDGRSLDIVGTVKLDLTLGDWGTRHEFLVTTAELTGPILGTDFLLAHGMVVDLGRRQLRWPEHAVELMTPAADSLKYVALLEDAQLEGEEIAVVRGKMVDAEGRPTKRLGDCVMEPKQSLIEKGMPVAKSVVDASGGCVPVQIVTAMAESKEILRALVSGRKYLFAVKRDSPLKDIAREAETVFNRLYAPESPVSIVHFQDEDGFDLDPELTFDCLSFDRNSCLVGVVDPERKHRSSERDKIEASDGSVGMAVVGSLEEGGGPVMGALDGSVADAGSCLQEPFEEVEEVSTTTEYGNEVKQQLAMMQDFTELKVAEAQKKQREAYDERSGELPTFEKGDLVWLYSPEVGRGKTKKLSRPYKGPYIIVQKIGGVNVKVKKLKGGKVQRVHLNRVKACYYHPQPPGAEPDEEDEDREPAETARRQRNDARRIQERDPYTDQFLPEVDIDGNGTLMPEQPGVELDVPPPLPGDADVEPENPVPVVQPVEVGRPQRERHVPVYLREDYDLRQDSSDEEY